MPLCFDRRHPCVSSFSTKKIGILDKIHCGEVHAPIYSYLGHWNRASLYWLSIQGYISPSVNALCFLS